MSRRRSASRESDSASLRGIKNDQREKGATTPISPPFAFWKTVTQPRITTQPSVVIKNTLRIYDAKQKLPSFVCARVCVCAGKPRGTRQRKTRVFPQMPLGFGRADCGDTDSSLTSVGNQSRLFLFLLQIIFSHSYAHTLACELLFGCLNEWTEGLRRTVGYGALREWMFVLFSIFLVINEQCCFLGLMGGTNTWFWYWNKK